MVLIWTYMIVIPSLFLAIPQIVFAVVGGLSARFCSRNREARPTISRKYGKMPPPAVGSPSNPMCQYRNK